MEIIKDITYVEPYGVSHLLDIYLPNIDTFPVFLYFHGGGIENGDKNDVGAFVKDFTENGIAVVSANYRMYPDASFPDFLVDAAKATAWVKNNISNYGECTALIIGGSSAGGYISQMLCFDRSYLLNEGINPDNIDGYVLDAGQPTAHFNVLKYKGMDSRRVIIDETAPLYFIEGGRNYPPIKIIVSDNDMENRYEQTMLLYSTLKHFGNDMDKVDLQVAKNSNHCEYLNKFDENGINLFSKMTIEFIKECAK